MAVEEETKGVDISPPYYLAKDENINQCEWTFWQGQSPPSFSFYR